MRGAPERGKNRREREKEKGRKVGRYIDSAQQESMTLGEDSLKPQNQRSRSWIFIIY